MNWDYATVASLRRRRYFWASSALAPHVAHAITPERKKKKPFKKFKPNKKHERRQQFISNGHEGFHGEDYFLKDLSFFMQGEMPRALFFSFFFFWINLNSLTPRCSSCQQCTCQARRHPGVLAWFVCEVCEREREKSLGEKEGRVAESKNSKKKKKKKKRKKIFRLFGWCLRNSREKTVIFSENPSTPSSTFSLHLSPNFTFTIHSSLKPLSFSLLFLGFIHFFQVGISWGFRLLLLCVKVLFCRPLDLPLHPSIPPTSIPYFFHNHVDAAWWFWSVLREDQGGRAWSWLLHSHFRLNRRRLHLLCQNPSRNTSCTLHLTSPPALLNHSPSLLHSLLPPSFLLLPPPSSSLPFPSFLL